MTRLLAYFALALPLWSQVLEIVTTDDGEQTYFTSTLVLNAGSDAVPGEFYVYRLSGNRVSLFAERGAVPRPDTTHVTGGVGSIQVSGDGQSVGLAMMNVCASEDCGTITDRAEILGPYAQSLGDGVVHLSRNGEWAVLQVLPRGPGSRVGDLAPQPLSATLINLRTGFRAAIPLPATRVNSVASDGTVLVRTDSTSGMGLWKDGESTEIRVPGRADVIPVALSSDGQRLVYMTAPESRGSQLMVRDLATGTETVLAWGAPEGRQVLLGASNNAGRLLILSRPNSYESRIAVVEVPGRSTEFVLPSGEFVTAGTISGLGNVVFLFTNFGRLLRFDDKGNQWQASEVIAATPHFCCEPLSFSPGQVVRLQASLPDGATWPNRIFLGDVPLPVLASDATGITVQIPWELQPGVQNLRIEYTTASPFPLPQPVRIVPATPRYLEPEAPRAVGVLRGVTMLRADSGTAVDSPPEPGDVVHVYMTGLGQVHGHVQNGVPAYDVRPLVASVTCRFLPQTQDAETVFAGLAPETVGVYRVTLRMPPDAGDPLTGLSCRIDSEGASSNVLYLEEAAAVL